MHRREAVQKLTFLLGGVISAPLMAGIMNEKLNHGAFISANDNQKALIAEMADVIIPTTKTPGAKAAGAENFIVRVMRDCYELADQEKFYAGLDRLNIASMTAFKKDFLSLNTEQKNHIVKQTTETDVAFFKQMKGLTVTAYFTSEIGATQALDYLPIPGRFDGSWPMPKGQKTWAL